jgi:phosphate:Na+ symporter
MGEHTWFEVTTGLVGGLALFMLGLQQLTRALQNVASGRLRTLLLHLSRTPARGALSGAITTAVIQSSTATVVLIVGFVAAGAMALPQAVAVVLGANLGTTFTIQIIAFDVTRFALLMIAVGLAVSTMRRFEAFHGPARALLAIGLVFLGMDIMASGVAPLRASPVVPQLLVDHGGVAVGFLLGAVFTATVQSSSATSGILIVLASQGMLDLETGIAVLFGASIGTCVTPLLAGLGTERAGLRVAVVHTLVNVVGVGLWIWWIPQLGALATVVSPVHPELADTARLAAETPRQLANAYTIFKLANLLLFVGLTRPVAAAVERLVPDRSDVDRLGARYLDDEVVRTPDVALELVRRELARMADEVVAVVDDAMPIVLHGSHEHLEALAARDRRVDAIYEDLLAYLGEIGENELSDSQSRELFAALAVANDLETIGDVVEINLVQIGLRRLDEGVLPSPPTTRVVSELHGAVLDQLRLVRDALATAETAPADRILTARDDLSAQRRDTLDHLTRRLRADAPNRLRSYEREVEVVGHLQRISALTAHIARNLPFDRRMGPDGIGRPPVR